MTEPVKFHLTLFQRVTTALCIAGALGMSGAAITGGRTFLKTVKTNGEVVARVDASVDVLLPRMDVIARDQRRIINEAARARQNDRALWCEIKRHHGEPCPIDYVMRDDLN